MKIGRILFSLIVLSSLFSHAQTSCRIENPRSGTGAERTRLVRFPDGRELYLIGHNHGDRAYPFELSKLLSRSESLTARDFLEQLDALAQGIVVAARQAPEDLSYLRSLLTSNPRLKFVGFESTDEVLRNNLIQYTAFHNDFFAKLSQRGIEPTERLKNMILVALGPACFVKINEPSLFIDRTARGFESERATERAERAEAEAEGAHEELKKIAGHDREFMGNISGTDFQLWMQVYPGYVPERDDPKVIGKIEKAAIPEAYRQATMNWIVARLAEMAAMKQREIDVAEGMLATGQSGVLIMGERHMNSVASILKAKCENSAR